MLCWTLAPPASSHHPLNRYLTLAEAVCLLLCTYGAAQVHSRHAPLRARRSSNSTEHDMSYVVCEYRHAGLPFCFLCQKGLLYTSRPIQSEIAIASSEQVIHPTHSPSQKLTHRPPTTPIHPPQKLPHPPHIPLPIHYTLLTLNRRNQTRQRLIHLILRNPRTQTHNSTI